MLNYVKRHWNETRGDEHDAWGASWWFFEVDGDGWVSRQIVQYESSKTLCYSVEHESDEYGVLAEKPLDLSEAEYSAISRQEFESLWQHS